MWYSNIQITCSSKTHSHVDIQVRNNVVLGIYMHVHNVLYTLHPVHQCFKLKKKLL